MANTDQIQKYQYVDLDKVDSDILLYEDDPDSKYGLSEDGSILLVQFDMYSVGDRLLDGVTADVAIDVTGSSPKPISIKWSNDAVVKYMKKLNEDYWKTQAMNSIKDALSDIVYSDDFANCAYAVGRKSDLGTIVWLEW